MTCCAADIRFASWVVRNDCGYAVKEKEWVVIEARVDVRYHRAYGKAGPVLIAKQVSPAEAPEEEVATFY